MNIQERINYFSQNMNLKFCKNQIGKIKILRIEVGRYLDKEIKSKSKMPLQFTSQDLRSLTIQLEKMHKLANKQISFTEGEKRLVKRIEKLKDAINKETDPIKKDKLRKKAYSDETNYLAEFMALARDLQMLISCFNYYALDTLLLEKIAEKNKEDDDKILRDELEFILFDLMRTQDPMV